MIFLNLIVSFIYIFCRFDFKDFSYKFQHFSGENYSIFYPNIFFSIYYFGCLLGFCFYYYSEYLIKIQLKRKSQNKGVPLGNIKNITNESSSSINRRSSLSSDDACKEEEKDNFYQPMKLCSNFIIRIKQIDIKIKIILLIIYLILGTLMTVIALLYIKSLDNFDIKLEKKSHPLFVFYFFEKIINIFLFIFFICLILVFPKKYKLFKILRSTVFIPLSRAGFFVTCSYQSLIFILYCLFELKILNYY